MKFLLLLLLVSCDLTNRMEAVVGRVDVPAEVLTWIETKIDKNTANFVAGNTFWSVGLDDNVMGLFVDTYHDGAIILLNKDLPVDVSFIVVHEVTHYVQAIKLGKYAFDFDANDYSLANLDLNNLTNLRLEQEACLMDTLWWMDHDTFIQNDASNAYRNKILTKSDYYKIENYLKSAKIIRR